MVLRRSAPWNPVFPAFSHTAQLTISTQKLHNASIWHLSSLAVYQLPFNHHTRTQDRTPSFPFISPHPYQFQTALPPTQSSTCMDNKLCHISTHVDATLDPLHCHSHGKSCSRSTSLFFVFWMAWNLQDHSGDYSCHMDCCFAVIGWILSILHFLEYEGAESELGIQTEMKRCKEDEARWWVSNK
jgi:hypothetical protein